MSWRSDDWDSGEIAKSIKDKIELAHGFGFTTAENYVEAGAEAMLEGLKASGYHYKPDSKHKTLSINDIVCDQECWIVIVPKE